MLIGIDFEREHDGYEPMHVHVGHADARLNIDSF